MEAAEDLEAQKWIHEVFQQRALDNARSIWEGHLYETRNALEARAEHLRLLASLSALIAGFDLVAMIQFGFLAADVPLGLLLTFGITNGFTVALMTCCMASCTLILASIMKTGANLLGEEEEEAFFMQAREFALNYKPGAAPPTPRRSFTAHWELQCEPEWRRALFLFSTGLLAFLVNVALSAFIKFVEFQLPSILLSIPLGFAFVYFWVTHVHWAKHLTSSNISLLTVKATKAAGLPFDWHRVASKGVTEAVMADPVNFEKFDLSSLVIKTEAKAQLQLLHKWRQQDTEQQVLDNARWLWQRFVRNTRFAMEEKVEQLRSFSFLSGLVAGFGVASLLQVNFEPLETRFLHQLGYAITVGLTATLATLSMALCSLVQMSVLKTGAALVQPEEECAFILSCRAFAIRHRPGDRPPAPRRSFRAHWEQRCEHQWRRAFWMFSAGLLLLQLNLIFAAWIKFFPNVSTPVCETVILGLGLLYLIGGHVRWVRHLVGDASRPGKVMEVQGEPVGMPWDWHLRPEPAKPPLESRDPQGSTLRAQLHWAGSWRHISLGLRRSHSEDGSSSLWRQPSLKPIFEQRTIS